MQIFVRTVKGGRVIPLEVESEDSVQTLKCRLQELVGVPSAEQRLKLKGKDLDDTSSLMDCKIKNKATLFLMYSVPTKPKKEPVKCISGCGFWGHESTKGHCSQCYQKLSQEERDKLEGKNGTSAQVEVTEEAAKSTESVNEEVKDESGTAQSQESVTDMETEENQEPQREQVDKTRCFECNKKVGIYGIECRCKYVFCGKHRYSDQHSCKFNYHESGRKRLQELNPQIVGEKVSKIA